jgi:hypothetical protein
LSSNLPHTFRVIINGPLHVRFGAVMGPFRRGNVQFRSCCRRLMDMTRIHWMIVLVLTFMACLVALPALV